MTILNSKILFYLVFLPIFVACELKEEGLVASVEKETNSKTTNVAIHLENSSQDATGIELELSMQSLELLVRKSGVVYRLVLLEDQMIRLGEQGIESISRFNSLNVSEEMEILAVQFLLNKSQHRAVDIEGNVCEIQNLPANRRLVQIALARSVNIEEAFDYDLQLNFNVGNSIELKRNGKCKLKPQLSLPLFLRRAKSSLANDRISLERLMTDGLDENQTDEEDDGFMSLKEIKNLPILRL
ncbi:MAG: hypothetical protein VX583_06425 [Bdellovibrionota bacterium]